MPILRYIVIAVARCSWSCSRLSMRVVEPAKAEVAVSNERSHNEFVGEGQRLAVIAFGALRVARRRDVTG